MEHSLHLPQLCSLFLKPVINMIQSVTSLAATFSTTVPFPVLSIPAFDFAHLLLCTRFLCYQFWSFSRNRGVLLSTWKGTWQIIFHLQWFSSSGKDPVGDSTSSCFVILTKIQLANLSALILVTWP